MTKLTKMSIFFLISVINSICICTGSSNSNSNSNSSSSISAPPFSAPVDIMQALTTSHGFNVFASILSASNLISEFQNDESGAGLTIFVPTDTAFSNIKPYTTFQSLSAEQKGNVLRFHCIRSYYPLGSLQAMVNPVQPTLATEVMGAGKYTLNMKSVKGSVLLDTGIVVARVDQTVFDEKPVVIFGVPVVFLPKEIFGGVEVVTSKRGNEVVGATAPVGSDAPLGPVVKSGANVSGFGLGLKIVFLVFLCIWNGLVGY